MKDNDEMYPALTIGNFILGGGTLSSRLGDRVRQQEGLSYGIRSISSAHPIDDRGSMMIYAITNLLPAKLSFFLVVLFLIVVKHNLLQLPAVQKQNSLQ